METNDDLQPEVPAVEVEVEFLCPPGCPNQGKSPSVLINAQRPRQLGAKDAVLIAFAIIVIAWVGRIYTEKKAPSIIEYALAAVGLFSLVVAPVESKDLSLSILKLAVNKIGGVTQPQAIEVTVNHVTQPRADHSQGH